MRLTYFDDAGLFNKQQEPFVVVGGVIVDADKQLVAVEEHIETLVKKHIPEEDWDDFCFHAMELWSGGRYFKREEWPLEKRLEIFADLAEIPKLFDLVLSFGFQERAFMQHAKFPAWVRERDVEIIMLSNAVLRFSEKIEEFMREVASDEITMLIAEDRDLIRKPLKEVHAHYRDPKWIKETNPQLVFFPFERIRDTIHFATKRESKMLQIADMCTFIIKKRLEENEHIRSLYAAIKPNLMVLPKDEDEAAESW